MHAYGVHSKRIKLLFIFISYIFISKHSKCSVETWTMHDKWNKQNKKNKNLQKINMTK